MEVEVEVAEALLLLLPLIPVELLALVCYRALTSHYYYSSHQH